MGGLIGEIGRGKQRGEVRDKEEGEGVGWVARKKGRMKGVLHEWGEFMDGLKGG